MLKVLQDEHRKNFWNLLASISATRKAKALGEVPSASATNLLHFYAAEVGLKYLLSKSAKIPFRHEITGKVEHVEFFSHRIVDMIARLKVPAARVPAPPKATFRCVPGFNDGTGGQRFSLGEAHEAWRYGLTIDVADEVNITGYLAHVTAYLEKELPK
ncbi:MULTISPECIES: hypothetical protein [unclassified Mesorhizobium]|uniref:hypothetical protein n=1 Tax=unclassified Mesorhizobium TaxID=325217 RepID=UPI00112DE55C|nr:MULTISPECIES: hypothetical protein [unclassified Mesorhizobium]TPM02497.1 hypothetical protein FJ960_18015 [Mesorhizobium sp. B2-3-11]